MKMLILSFVSILVGFFSLGQSAVAGVFDPEPEIPYCADGDCGVEKGVDLVKTGIKDIRTDGTFSENIQEIIVYALSFITLVAVIYIMYAGARILLSGGDEEAMKKSKTTILYVIIGIVVIWFAWTIAVFALQLASSGTSLT